MKHKIETCPNTGRGLRRTLFGDASALPIALRSHQRGQALALVALALVALIGFVALAVDVGLMWGARRRMQTAADAAALAGAIASRQGQGSGNVATAATDVAALNGFSSGVSPNPSYSRGGCSANCVQVTITQDQPTYFLKALGFSKMTVSASAVAGTMNSGSCIYGLGPASPGFDAHGNATVSSSCGILVNTTANCGGNVTVTAPIGVAGSSSGCPNASTISYTPDPFAYLGCSTPSCMPSCSGNTSENITNGQIVTLTPGSYCGGITIHNGATVVFSSGTYNLGSAGMSITGGLVTGAGVTFVSTGAVSSNGNGILNLSAPTSDTYVGSADVKGVLFWDTSSSSSRVAGGSGSTFDGALYFPQSQLTFTGNSSSGCGTAACSTGSSTGCGYTIIAADAVQFGGTTNFCDDYSALAGGASPIESTTLYQ